MQCRRYNAADRKVNRTSPPLCGFEMYDRATHHMGTCGSEAVGRCGRTPLCEDHYRYVEAKENQR